MVEARSSSTTGTRASIKDVAALAGVSTATVSRVLTGARPVRPEHIHAVRQASEALHYRPDQLARSLRRGKSGVIGLVVPQVSNPFFPDLVRAAETSLRQSGFALIIANSGDDPEVEAGRVEMLVDRQVDGILISACHHTLSTASLAQAAKQVPLVQLDRATNGLDAPFVGVDDEAAIRELVSMATKNGRRRFAYIGGSTQNWSGHHRAAAFVHWACKVDKRASDRMEIGTFSREWGRQAAQTLLARSDRPDVIVCGDDLIAVGVLDAAESSGLQVPVDIAVSGFDDIDVATVCKPALTTVRQPVAEMVGRAIDLLLNGIEGRKAESVWMLLPAEVIERGSLEAMTHSGF